MVHFSSHKLLISICVCSLILTGARPVTAPTQVTITNGLISARLYLPDAENGYYRAVRFDWSGIIAGLDWNSHSYYGQWFARYDPLVNDAITGPVESFDPIGYDEAKPGEPFLKIGVGELKKQDSLPYNFMKYYPIVNEGKWKVKSSKDRVEFRQSLSGKEYGYEYTKTVELVKNKPVMILHHTLKNTGARTIETLAFDHNFMVMDEQLTGPGFTVTFPDAPAEKVNAGMEDYATLQNNQLIFTKELDGKNVYFKDVTNGRGAVYNFNVENHNTGAGVKITGDRPVIKFAFWSWTKTVCPEPYIKIDVKPGATFTWNITYKYYNCKITKSN